jgi:hypothetical protein
MTERAAMDRITLRSAFQRLPRARRYALGNAARESLAVKASRSTSRPITNSVSAGNFAE